MLGTDWGLFRRRWIDGFLALMLVLGLASTLNVARSIGQPYGGFFVWRNPGRNAWQLEGSIPSGWPVLAEGYLRSDDDLLAIDGQPYDTNAGQVYAAAYDQGHAFVRLTIRRNGALQDVTVPLERFSLNQFFDIKLPDLINGLGFWVLAAAVYGARPRDPVNRRFALGCGLVAGSLWLTIVALFPGASLAGQLLHVAWICSAAFVGPAFIHLFAIYPQPLNLRVQRWMPAAYLAGAALAAIYAPSTLLWWIGERSSWVVALNGFSLQATMALFGLMVVFVLARLFYLVWIWLIIRQQNTSPRQRHQVLFMLAGIAMALPFVVLTVGRTTFANAGSYFLSGLDVRYLLLAFPLSYAFIILRYQVFRGAQPLLVAMLILLSSALLASVGAWLAPLLMPQWRGLMGSTLFPTLFIIALGSSLFWSTRRAWQGAFNRLFQWEQRSFAAVREVSGHVMEQIDLRHLPDTIADALVDHLQVGYVAVWLWNEKEQVFRLAAGTGPWPDTLPANCCPNPQAFARPMRLEAQDLPPAFEPLRATEAADVIAPLWASGELIGLLGLGQRSDEEIFGERDLEIIELVSQQMALFLFAALQMEQLRQVPERMARRVAEAQERERFGIAQELHDTTQQFLGRLPFFLAMSRDAVRSDPAEAEGILERCLVDVESAAETLRQIRNNLAPTALAQSLEKPLRLLVDQTRQRSGLTLQLEMEPGVDAGLAGQPEARHALYRVVQQAIDNAVAHAQATEIAILLRSSAGRIEFSIADNGRGSSEAERNQAAERGSFGLKSMQARVTSLGGEFALDSTPGQGTTVRGWLPAVAAGAITTTAG